MKKFILTYDFKTYRPSSYFLYQKQLEFKEIIVAGSLEDAKESCKHDYNLNPFYMKFTEI